VRVVAQLLHRRQQMLAAQVHGHLAAVDHHPLDRAGDSLVGQHALEPVGELVEPPAVRGAGWRRA
jgi:hypothetical protein